MAVTWLHQERIANGQKITYSELLTNLPRGTFVTITRKPQAYLVLEDALLTWHPQGYRERIDRPDDQVVQVPTPHSIVNVLAGGYPVNIHLSASEAG